MSKKVLCVRFENVIADEDWRPISGSVEWLKQLKDVYEIIVVSVEAGTSGGLRRVMQFLQDEGIPYDEVWSGFCLPRHDVYFDPHAITSFEKLV